MDQMEVESQVTEMVMAEYSQFGDMKHAVERVSRDCKLGFWTVENIRKRRAKSPASRVLQSIHKGYLNYCERQISQYQEKLIKARQIGNEYDHVLLGEIEIILAKIKDKKLKI